MGKKFMLVGLLVLTLGMLPLSADLSGFSKVFASSSTAFTSPVLPQPTAVPTKAAPVPTKPAPVPTKAAPVPTKPAPEPTKAAPVPTKPAPVPTKAAPVPTKPAPVPTKAAPAPTKPVKICKTVRMPQGSVRICRWVNPTTGR